MKSSSVVKALVVLLGLTALSACSMVTVDPGHVGVRFNRYSGNDGEREVLQPRFYWLGLNDRVWQYQTYTMTMNLCAEPADHQQNDSITYAPQLNFQSVDNAVIGACVAVNYRADEAKVYTLFEEFRSQGSGDDHPLDSIGRTWLRQRIADALAAEGVKYTAFQASANRMAILQAVQDTVTAEAAEHGIIVEEMSWMGPLAYPDEVQRSITQTLTAIQAAERARQDLARAEAQAAVTRTEADAEAYAISTRASAIDRNPRVVEYIMAEAFREKWDGTLPTTSVGGNGALMLNLSPQR
jgi:regulator of protease activity HflC (stomatin/prohibitin superfamily)